MNKRQVVTGDRYPKTSTSFPRARVASHGTVQAGARGLDRRSGSASLSLTNAYVDRGDLVFVIRDGDKLSMLRRRAQYSCFLKSDDVDPELMLELRDSQFVIGILEEDGWIRISFIDRWKRRKGCEYLHRYGVQTYEGTVSPVLRCMADENHEVVRPRIAYLDLETDSRVSFAKMELMRILCWAVVDENGNEFYDSLVSNSDRREKDLLDSLWRTLEPYDLILAWNGDKFDFPVLKARNERRGITVDMRRWLWLDHMELFIKSNAMAAKSGEEKASYKLGDVAQELLGYGKADLDASKTWEHWKVGGRLRKKLIDYNVKDTTLMRDIEKKTGYIDLLIAVCQVCGVFPDSYGMNKMTQAEGYMQRLGLSIDYKFPTRLDRGEGEQYRGAYVMEPTRTGIIKDVHVADFSSLYPSIITTWNMSTETKTKDEDSALSPLTGIRFKTEPEGILPKAISDMVRLRKKWSDLKEKEPPGSDAWIDYDRRSTASKITANSFYGVVGTMYSWLFDPEVAESVSLCGKWLIEETIKIAVARGMEVIYADTDSIFVVGSSKAVFEGFVRECNTELYPKLLSELSCKDNHIKLAYEKQFERIVFTKKKRYVGKYKHYKGTKASADSRPEIKGIEYKRGDSLSLARDLLKDVVYKLVGSKPSEDPDEYDELMNSWFERIITGELELKDVVVSKRLSKNLKAYPKIKKKNGDWKKQPPHVEVAKLMREEGEDVQAGTKIDYVIVGRDDGVIPVPASKWDGELDRYALWNEQVAKPTVRLLVAAFPEKKWDNWLKMKDRSGGNLELPFANSQE